MHRNNLRTIAIAAAFTMALQAPALGANLCPNYQRNTGTSNCLYKRDIEDAAARIVWGNRASERALYRDGSGTAELVFTYTVGAGDSDSDGINIGANSVKLGSGEYIRGAGNGPEAVLTHSQPGTQSGHKVDGSLSPPADDDDDTAPALDTIIPPAVNGTSLVLTWDEPLDGSSEPVPGAFTVTVEGTARTVTDVAVSGATVTLTLSPAVAANETVKVSYAVPDTNPIQDVSGNDAGAFTDRAVTNTNPDTTPPTLSAAVVNGATLTLTFDEALDEDSVPRPAAFSVSVDGGAGAQPSSVKVSGETVTLALVSAVTDRRTVTVSYTKPGTSPLQDVAGNDAAGFTTGSGDVPAVANESDDTTAPVLSTAVVAGASLVLTYDEALDEDSVPAKAAFTVKVTPRGGTEATRGLASGTPVAISAEVVTLTLSSAVVDTDTVTVSYTVPASNPIQDDAENKAVALTNEAVRNETPDTTAPGIADEIVANGVTVTIPYDDLLDTSQVPAASAYEVRIQPREGPRVARDLANVTPVAINGRNVVLTLASTVVDTDQVQVRYIKPATNALRNKAMLEAASFGPFIATNETEDTSVPLLETKTIGGDTITLTYDSERARTATAQSGRSGSTAP